jgi:hypothetical protein
MEEPKSKNHKECDVFHAHSPDGQHMIGIGNLRVVLLEDGGHWFAQALEIDYLSEGANLEEAKKNFEIGLKATINQHLQTFGKIDNMLKAAPPEVWKEAAFFPGATLKRFSQITMHEIMNDTADSVFPFDGVDYFMPAGVLNAAAVAV